MRWRMIYLPIFDAIAPLDGGADLTSMCRVGIFIMQSLDGVAAACRLVPRLLSAIEFCWKEAFL